MPEPFGQVVLEGMAAGLAVIAPDEGGPAAVVADGQTGRLFRSRDPDSLARRWRPSAPIRPSAGDLGGAAQHAAEDYDPGVLSKRIEKVYKDVLRARGRPVGEPW